MFNRNDYRDDDDDFYSTPDDCDDNVYNYNIIVPILFVQRANGNDWRNNKENIRH